MNVRIFEKFKWFYNKSTLEKIVKELLVWISFWGLVKKKKKNYEHGENIVYCWNFSKKSKLCKIVKYSKNIFYHYWINIHF